MLVALMQLSISVSFIKHSTFKMHWKIFICSFLFVWDSIFSVYISLVFQYQFDLVAYFSKQYSTSLLLWLVGRINHTTILKAIIVKVFGDIIFMLQYIKLSMTLAWCNCNCFMRLHIDPLKLIQEQIFPYFIQLHQTFVSSQQAFISSLISKNIH